MATKKELTEMLNDPKLREVLKEAGYKLSRHQDTMVTKTFKIPKGTIDAFYKKTEDLDLRIQDAVDEAMQDWIKKNS